MKERVEAACAGFLLTNALSYVLYVVSALLASASVTGMAASVLGALVCMTAGIRLLQRKKYARMLAAAVCASFVLPALYGVVTVTRVFGYAEGVHQLISPLLVGSLVALATLIVIGLRNEKSA